MKCEYFDTEQKVKVLNRFGTCKTEENLFQVCGFGFVNKDAVVNCRIFTMAITD